MSGGALRLPVSAVDLSLQVLNFEVHDYLNGGADVLDYLEAVCLAHELLLLCAKVPLVYLVKL